MSVPLIFRNDVPDGPDSDVDQVELSALRILTVAPDLIAHCGNWPFHDPDISLVILAMRELHAAGIVPTMVVLQRVLRQHSAIVDALHRQRDFALTWLTTDKELLKKELVELTDYRLHRYRKTIKKQLQTLAPDDTGTANALLHQLQFGRPDGGQPANTASVL